MAKNNHNSKTITNSGGQGVLYLWMSARHIFWDTLYIVPHGTQYSGKSVCTRSGRHLIEV